MADVDGRFVADDLVEFLVDLHLGDRVERGGRLVEHDDRRVLVERAGQHQALHLAARKLDAVLVERAADVRFAAVRQRAAALQQAGPFQRALHAGAVCAARRLRHIVRKRGFVDRKILKHGGKMAVIVAAVVFSDVLAVQQHGALGRVIKAADQLDQRRLAGAVQADDRELFAGRYLEADVLQRVLFRAGVAERDVLQLNRVRLFGVGLERLAVLKAERLRRLQIGADAVDFQTEAVQLGKTRENAGYPSREAADRREVQQKFRGGEAVLQRQKQQVGVGSAAAQKGQRDVREVAQKVNALLAEQKVPEHAHRGGVNVAQPAPHAEDADILEHRVAAGFGIDIIHMLGKAGLLLAPVEAPFCGARRCEVAERRGRKDDQNQHGVEREEQDQIDQEAGGILKKLRQRPPDGFAGGRIAVCGHLALFAFLEQRLIVEVRVRGRERFAADLHADVRAQRDAAEAGVLVCIRPQAAQQKKPGGKCGDRAEQHGQRRRGFHLPEHGRREEKLRHADRDVQRGKQQA